MKKVNWSSFKRINLPLVLGVVIILSLSVVVINPKAYTQKDPYFRYMMRLYNVTENGETVQKYETAPLRPNKDNIFGTDEFGRDILSRMSHGAKVTLYSAMLAAILRFIVAIPMGIWAGLGGKFSKSLIKGFSTIFTAVPQLITAYIVLNIGFISNMDVETSIVAFGIVFTFIGWGKLANQIQEKTSEIYGQDFVEGEVAIGKSTFMIAFQNILPHLIPSLTSFFFLEVGMVLFLLAQLSVLYVFVGPRLLYNDDIRGEWFMAQDPEWASMLSRAFINFRLGQWWIGLIPAAAFAYAIAGFNFVGEGLRIEFEKRTSRVVSFLRKIPFYISPRIYYSQLRKVRIYYKAVILKTLCYGGIIVFMLMPPPKSPYPFILPNTMETLNYLVSEGFDGRVAGTAGGYRAGEYIAEELKRHGIEPFFKEGYFQEYSLKTKLFANPTFFNPSINPHSEVMVRNIEKSSIKFNNQTYHIGRDYNIQKISLPKLYSEIIANNTSYIEVMSQNPVNPVVVDFKTDSNQLIEEVLSPISITGNIINYMDIVTGSLNLAQDFRDSILFLQHLQDFTDAGINVNISTVLKQAQNMNINTVIIHSPQENLRSGYTSIEDCTIILVNQKLGDDIKNSISSRIEIEFRLKQDHYADIGRNIVGVIRGSDPINSEGKEQYMIIGASYDGARGYEDHYYENASSTVGAAISLEIARILGSVEAKPKFHIIFLFWDGEHSVSGNQFYKFNTFLNPGVDSVYYIDIGHIGGDSTLYYLTESPKIYGEKSYEFINYIKKRLNLLKISNIPGRYASARYQNLINRNTFNIGFSSMDWNNYNTAEDRVESLDKEVIKNVGQIILDTLLWYCYGIGK